MIRKPSTADEVRQILSAAFSKNEKLERINLETLNRVVQYTPEDMTVTVQAGMTLAALQEELAKQRQWLPIDPPHPERLTIGELINDNPSGPRRCACGTIRDYLIGIEVALADGTIINSGGKVVKNVAGYDLAKLFVGSRGSLGVVIETTFKLRPLPEAEQFVQARCEFLEHADHLIEAAIKSPITPIVLDLHNLIQIAATETTSLECSAVPDAHPLSLGERAGVRVGVQTNSPLTTTLPPFTIILGFAGTREEVDWQLALAAELGFDQPSSLDHEAKFWGDTAPAQRLSMLPSRMAEAIRGLNGAPFIARAGNGVIYHRGPAARRREELPIELMRRVKDAYDPRHILPALPL